MSLGTLAIRGIVGPLFVGHGVQKLFGWLDGHGLDGTGGFFESLGLKPGKRHATAAGVAETAGGALLLLGGRRFTPIASTLISSTMITAIRKAHLANGPWVTQNGYEYNLVLIGAMFAVTERESGPAAAVAQLAAAAAGSALATSPLANAQDAPAPQEGDAGVPGDPATTGDADARFSRDPETAEMPSSPTGLS